MLGDFLVLAGFLGPRASWSNKSEVSRQLCLNLHFPMNAHEKVIVSFEDHGACRDVFFGYSERLGQLALKYNPAKYDSSRKEMDLMEKGFREFSSEWYWSGALPVGDTMCDVILQRRVVSVDAMLVHFCSDEQPSSQSIAAIVSCIRAVLDLFLDVTAAGFTFADAGPHNLAYDVSKKAAFLDFEHSECGSTKRKIWNQSVSRLIAGAAARIGRRSHCEWKAVAEELPAAALQGWWNHVDDAKLHGSDRQWLGFGMSLLASRLWNCCGLPLESMPEADIIAPVVKHFQMPQDDVAEWDSQHDETEARVQDIVDAPVPVEEVENVPPVSASDAGTESSRSSIERNSVLATIRRYYNFWCPQNLHRFEELCEKYKGGRS